jgi:hypothetical protein
MGFSIYRRSSHFNTDLVRGFPSHVWFTLANPKRPGAIPWSGQPKLWDHRAGNFTPIWGDAWYLFIKKNIAKTVRLTTWRQEFSFGDQNKMSTYVKHVLEHVHEEWSNFLFQLLQKAAKHAIVARGIARIPKSNANVQTIDYGAKSAKWSRFSPTLTYVSLTPQPSMISNPGQPSNLHPPSCREYSEGSTNKRWTSIYWRPARWWMKWWVYESIGFTVTKESYHSALPTRTPGFRQPVNVRSRLLDSCVQLTMIFNQDSTAL